MTADLPPEDRPPTPTRRTNRGLLWASALAVVVLAIATVVAFTAGNSGDSKNTTAISPDDLTGTGPALDGEDRTGQPVGDVTFTNFDGTTGSLADYAGRPLVVNFFASWCTPCVAEMPDFEQVHQTVGDRVAFLGLNVTEQPDSGQALINRTGVTYDTARDPDGGVLRSFGSTAMPTTVFVRADGTIAKVHAGRLARADLERTIADELGA